MGTPPLAHRVGGDEAGEVVVVGRVVVVVGRVVVVVGRVVVVVGRLIADRRVVGVDVVVAEPDRMLPPQSDEHATSPSRANRATPTRMARANVVVSLDMARFSPIDVVHFPSGTVPQRVVRLDVRPTSPVECNPI
jgi:hypothetical protein